MRSGGARSNVTSSLARSCNHGRGVLVADCLSKIGEHASHLVLGLGHVRPPLPLGFFMWVQSVGATRVPRAEGNRPIRTNGAVVSVGGPSVGRSAEGSTAYEQPALPVSVSFSLEAVATLLPATRLYPVIASGVRRGKSAVAEQPTRRSSGLAVAALRAPRGVARRIDDALCVAVHPFDGVLCQVVGLGAADGGQALGEDVAPHLRG